MISTVIPNILFSGNFWLIIAFGLIVVIHFALKKSPPPFPKAGKLIEKRTKRITTILDILIISLTLLWSYILLSFICVVFRTSSKYEPFRPIFQQSDLTITYALLIIWSGQSGLLVGFISFFNSNLTKTKRIILLIVCLLPIIFTVLLLLKDNTLGPWSIVQICLYSSAGSWIINTPLIFIGKNIFQVVGDILQKVKSLIGVHSV